MRHDGCAGPSLGGVTEACVCSLVPHIAIADEAPISRDLAMPARQSMRNTVAGTLEFKHQSVTVISCVVVLFRPKT